MVKDVNNFIRRYKESREIWQTYKIEVDTGDDLVDFDVEFNFVDGNLKKIVIDRKKSIDIKRNRITGIKRAIFDMFYFIEESVDLDEDSYAAAEECIEDWVNDIICTGPNGDFSDEEAIPELMEALCEMDDLLRPFHVTTFELD